MLTLDEAFAKLARLTAAGITHTGGLAAMSVLLPTLAAALLVTLLAFGPPASRAESSATGRSEAERLDSVREIVSKEPGARLTAPDGKRHPSGVAQCSRMLRDLLHRRGFSPTEPVAVLEHTYPFQPADRPMSERDEDLLPEPDRSESKKAGRELGALTESINRCADAEANGDEQRGAVLFNGFDATTGSPPFRIYRIRPEINPFPSAAIAYWSEFSREFTTGREGYTWVDLRRCERLGSIPVFTNSTLVEQDPEGQQAALATYHGGLAVWSTQRPNGFFVHVARPGAGDEGLTCFWETVRPSSGANLAPSSRSGMAGAGDHGLHR